MALIKAGVWHTTVWASGLWHEDLWLEYGTYVPPAPPAAVGGVRGRPIIIRKPEPRFPVELARLLKNYLEAKLGETHD